MHISEVLKRYRTEHHLYQKEMADRLGISREYYADIERGFKQAPYDLVVRITETLRTTFTIGPLKSTRTLRNGTHPRRR